MFTLEDLQAALTKEVAIIKHLSTKVPNAPDGYAYKPSAYQRSLEELMKYMLTMWSTMVTMFKDPWNMEAVKTVKEVWQAIALDDFASWMDEQLAVVVAYLDSVSEDDLHGDIDPFGMWMDQPLKTYIFGALYQTFVAYRMQLFLYLKGAGNTDLDTYNVWMWMDNPKR